MNKSNFEFKTVAKDQLFYDHYEYCFGFHLQEATALRGIKQQDCIDHNLNQRIEWREISSRRWRVGMSGKWNPITEQVRQDLHQVGDILVGADCKFVVSSDYGWVYTNDLTLIDELSAVACLRYKTYNKAVITRAKNTLLIKNSPHTARSYFNSAKLTVQEKQTLKSFFANHREHIRLSPGFNDWINNKPWQRLMDHYFIDYSGEQWLTMISLIRPGIIRKTKQIVTK